MPDSALDTYVYLVDSPCMTTAEDTITLDDHRTIVQHFAHVARRALIDRNGAIRAMRDAGASLREIAEAAGLSHGAIAKITDPS